MPCAICKLPTTQRCSQCKLHLCQKEECTTSVAHFSLCGKNALPEEGAKFLTDNGLAEATVIFSNGTEIPVTQLEQRAFEALRVVVALGLFDAAALSQLCATSRVYKELCDGMTFTVFYPSETGGKGRQLDLRGARELIEYTRAYTEYKQNLTNLWFPLVPQLLASRAYQLYERFRDQAIPLTGKELLHTLLRNGTLYAWNTYDGQRLFVRSVRAARTLGRRAFDAFAAPLVISMVSSPSTELFLANQELRETLTTPAKLFLNILMYQRRANWYEWLLSYTVTNPLTEFRDPDATYSYRELKYCVKKLNKTQAGIARGLLGQLLTPEQYIQYKAAEPSKPYQVIEPEQHKLV